MMSLASRSLALISRHSTLLCLVAVLLAAALVASFGSPVFARIVTGALISVVLVVGLHIFVGNSGILSFGHLGFVCIAAYVTAWLTLRPQFKSMMLPGLPDFIKQAHIHPFFAALASASVAAFVALASGAILVRLSGIAASIATLAFLAIVYAIYSNADSITGGVGSLAGIPSGLTPWSVLPWACLAIVIAHAYAGSASGLALRAVRDDEIAARAAGIMRFRVRLTAYVASAFVCGLAGYLQARFLGVVSPESFYFNATLGALTMLIIGGKYSLSGAVVGVFAVTAVSELLIRSEGAHEMLGMAITIPAGAANCILAAVLCLVLIRRPQGMMGDSELRLPARFRARRTTDHAINSIEADQKEKGGQNP